MPHTKINSRWIKVSNKKQNAKNLVKNKWEYALDLENWIGLQTRHQRIKNFNLLKLTTPSLKNEKTIYKPGEDILNTHT